MINQIKTKRNSNIELLRIIAMLMIVFSHYASHGSLYQSTDITFVFNKILIDSMFLGNLGVAIFMTITGYFMSKVKFNINRIINLWMQTLFYSIIIFIVFCIIDRNNFSIGGAINSFLPVVRSNYWFVTAYIILCCFMPFLNKLFEVINRKQFLVLISLLVIIYFFLPTFIKFDFSRYAGRVTQFVAFYCLGAYIRYYPNNVFSNNKVSVGIVSLTGLGMLSTVILFDILSTRMEAFVGKNEYFYATFSVVQLFLALSMFTLALNLKAKYNNFVNAVGSCTFGVYLIHDNPFVRDWLWGNVFNNISYANSKFLILHMIASVLIVYVVCIMIEAIRKFVVEKYILKKPYELLYNLANNMSIYMQKKLQKFK